ncbi:ArsC family reductase [Caenimonas sp. SL110]|uniref:ArsC family reductase n=1 Tax=Caenimonas sp. SL110 TaxID=1450524 RepID=UPI0006537737|nr:ArsC family reductase [Caenimonas sp. SL110]
MTPVLHGIPNCDTVKKARAWLTERGIDYTFHDFKKLGVPADRLDDWIAQVGWEKLVNRQGNTWRKLDAQVQASVKDAESAKAVMNQYPSVIKRPVVDWGDQTTVGFSPDTWASTIAQ